MFCSKCGKENIDNAKFCINCGSPLAAQILKDISVSNSDKINSDEKDKSSKLGKIMRWILGSFFIIPAIFAVKNPFAIVFGLMILPINYKIISKEIRIAIAVIAFFGIGSWAGMHANEKNLHTSTTKTSIIKEASYTDNKKINSNIKNNIDKNAILNIKKSISIANQNNDIENKKNLEILLKKVQKTVDEVEERIVYESWNSIENHRDDCYLKLVQSKNTNQCTLFWYIDYYNNSTTPLFISNFTVKADNFKQKISLPLFGVNNELYMEKMVLPYKDHEDVINAIANSQNTTIRFQGMHYYDDRKISTSKINALKDMINLYNLCINGYL